MLAVPLPTFSWFLVLSSFPLPQMSTSQDSDLGRHSSHSTSLRESLATPETELRMAVIPGVQNTRYLTETRASRHIMLHWSSLLPSWQCAPVYLAIDSLGHHSHPSHHQVLLPKAQPSSLLPLSHHILIASCQDSCKSFQLPLPHPPKHILSTACRMPSTQPNLVHHS